MHLPCIDKNNTYVFLHTSKEIEKFKVLFIVRKIKGCAYWLS